MQIVGFIRDGDRAQLNSKKYGLKRLILNSEPLQTREPATAAELFYHFNKLKGLIL